MRKTVSYIGLAVGTSSISLLIAGVYGLVVYRVEGDPWELEIATRLITFGSLYLVVGLLTSRIRTEPLKISEGILLTVLVWILVPALTALVLTNAMGIPFIDALFESAGGWSTTGLTIMSGENSSWNGVYVPSIDELPDTIKMWRSSMQWLGGLGIVIFTIALLARPGVSAAVLYIAEGRYERLEASLKRSAYRLGIIYVALTGISIFLLYVSGMDLIDSIHHAMTGISTAGFSPHSNSIAYYLNNNKVLIASLIVSFLGAMNFVDHHNILTLRWSRLKESIELKAQLVILVIVILLSIALWINDPILRGAYTMKQAIYDAVSAYTTVGFQSGDLGSASPSYKTLLLVFSAIGGTAFSTAGGIKILRIVIAAKVLSMEAEVFSRPHGYTPSRRMGKYILDERLIRRTMATITAFTFIYIILLTVVVMLYPETYKIEDLMFEVGSALFNIGLSTGITSASAPILIKVVLIVGMLMGRLEVLVFFIALKYVVNWVKRMAS
ncbi:MAG: TrkH family potassium uptake protein [Desulfurococcales archaeon]|nr:TrkH family potassium uptake protein [Desulfurococcales archaeon]